jgi:type II secretory pathway pseudopilin PulG
MKNNKGQILIEILVAVTIFAFLAVSIYGLISITRKTSRNSIQKMQAQNLVQEGIEMVRSIRDYNLHNPGAYDAGLGTGDYVVRQMLADSNRFELFTPPPPPTPPEESLIIGNNVFKRIIQIDNDPITQTLTVTVTVKWNNTSEEKAVTYLTNWKK